MLPLCCIQEPKTLSLLRIKLSGTGSHNVESAIDKAMLLEGFFIRPSSDGTYYGMVMPVRPSVRVSVRPSIRPSVRPSQFSAVFSYML